VTAPAVISQVQATTSTTAVGAEPPKPGGTVTYAMFTDSRGFDPVQGTSAGRAGDSPQYNAVFDSLLYEDVNTGDLTAQIADSLTSADGLVWTLKIKKNVKFSDGTAYDASAVKFNWQRIGDPANASANLAGMTNVASLDIIDSQTLKVTLKSVSGQFARNVAKRLTYIASPTALQQKGSGFSSSPVGAGPFLFKEWVRNDHLTLVRNPSYWNAPKPYLDQVIVRQISDDEQRYNTLKSGEIDFAESGTNPTYGQRAVADGFATFETDPSGGLSFIFNETKPPFNDVRVRKAIALSMDLKGLNTAVYNGNNEVPTTFFNATSPFYDASLVRPEATGPNITQAQSLIDSYGQPVKFTMLATTATETAYEYIQALVSKLKNVSAGIEVIPSSGLQPRLIAGNFDLAGYAFTSTDPEPDLYDQLHTGAALNFGKYSNSDLDKALEAGRSALDQNARRQAYLSAQQIMNNDVPQVYFARFLQFDLYKKKIQDLYHTNVGPMWDRMWIKS
jgi:peptide/nickel transport system substrate-binding protein